MKIIVKKSHDTLPHITPKQKQLLSHLYQFRFLHTQQLQKLFNHKNPRMVQLWLKDLLTKGYIKRQEYTNTRENITKPGVYFLTLSSRQFLKLDVKFDLEALDKLYKEAKRTESFIRYCLTLADIYLYFLSQKKKTEEIRFFTESQLLQYDYFLKPRPSAYIAVTSKEKTKRYFLELFKEYATVGVIRFRLKAYLEYLDSKQWEEHAEGEDFPMLLFICPTEKMKKHIYYYAKALFAKENEERLTLFLTTRVPSTDTLVWDSVEI